MPHPAARRTRMPGRKRTAGGTEPDDTGHSGTLGHMGKRAQPTLAVQRALLETFEGCCAYCDYPIGTVLRRPGRQTVSTVLHWGHAVPYAWLQANPSRNWVPACDACNGIKGARMYADLDEARESIGKRWEEKRYGVVWIPPVPSVVDPRRWATAYATYLTERAA